jgi:LEA14-like dessication related protein
VTDTRPVDPIDTDISLIPDTPLYVNETSASWGRITENRTFLDLSIALYNLSAIPYPISTLEYTVSLNNVTVGHGATEQAYTIPPGTERTINGTVVIDNSALDGWWVTHIKHNQTTDVQIDVTALIELPNGETIRLPLGPLTPTNTFETDLFGTKNGAKGEVKQ